jgi:hypothetical protein
MRHHNKFRENQMKTTTKMKISLVLAVGFLLVFSKSLFACHQILLKGHTSDKVGANKPKPKGVFGMMTQYITEPSTDGVTASSYGTTDSSATTTDCKWRTANIEKFFNESYEQIAEESAQGSGKHLEALASLTGCSAEQYGTFETVMNRSHRYVFADKDYDGSINNFFTVLNTDEDLKQCWGQS